MAPCVYLGALTVLLVVGSVYPCCTPEQWEGLEMSDTGLVRDGEPQVVQTSARTSYDFINKRLATYTNVSTEDSPTQMMFTLMLYQEHMQYNLNMATGECTAMDLEGDFMEYCIPEGAMYLGQAYYGLSQLLAVGYSFSVDVQGSMMKGSVAVTPSECVPITEQIYGTVNEVQLLTTTDFLNITGGIRDTHVFDVPEVCAQAPIIKDHSAPFIFPGKFPSAATRANKMAATVKHFNRH